MNIFDLIGTISLQGADRIGSQLNTVGSQMTNLGGSITAFGGALTAGLTVPILGLMGKATMLASDLAEVENVVNVTFGNASKDVKAWSKTLLDSYGMVELESMKYVGSMGAMLKSSGLNADASREMSQKLVELTGDMSSFYNLNHEETWEKIRSGISGETEPLKQLGINMSVANLEAFALTKGINKSWTEMSQAEQVTLRYNYLMKVTADSQGDFSRTSDTFANKLRIVGGRLTDIGTKIGNILLPYVLKAVTFIEMLVSKFNNLSEHGQKITVIVGLIIASIGPLIATFGTLITLAGFIITGIGAIAGVISSIGFAIPAVIGTVGLLITIIGGLGLASEEGRDKISTAFGDIVEKIKGAVVYVITHMDDIKASIIAFVMKVQEFATKINEFIAPLKNMFAETFSKFDTGAIVKAFNNMKESLGPLIELLKAVGIVIGGVLATAVSIAVGLWNGLIGAIDNVIAALTGLVGVVTSVFNIIIGIITLDGEMIKKGFADLWENVKSLFVNVFMAIIDFVKGFINGIITFFTTLYDTLVGHSIVPDLVREILSNFTHLIETARSILSRLVDIAVNIFGNFVNTILNFVGSARNAANNIAYAIFSAIENMDSSLYQSGRNLIQSIVDGILSMLSKVKNAASQVAKTIKNYIGWESPTKEGPGSTSDKWASNLVNMMVKGLDDGVVRLRSASLNVANAINPMDKVSMQGATTLSKQEVYNFNGDITIDSNKITDISDIINIFKNLKQEAVSRGGAY